MLNKKIYTILLMLATGVMIPASSMGQRCKQHVQRVHGNTKVKTSPDLSPRTTYSFQMVFHILYSNESENISLSQIHSQLEILNAIYNGKTNSNDLNIPIPFRHLKTSPGISFCLADKDPSGRGTTGITRTKINDLFIGCKDEFMKRSIMHESLGGVDAWNPQQYINVYVVNFRDNCQFLGEAIYPWDATMEEDGIIIDYRAVGFIGASAMNHPFDLGKTLVHELGHYFGLKHLSDDVKNCQGDDLAADTPPQSQEYFGCPTYPQVSCGNMSMTMNYMSQVNDGCMHLFTKDQVNRMQLLITQYRSSLALNPCISKPIVHADQLIWLYDQGAWQIKHPDLRPWNAQLELFDISGKTIWCGTANQQITLSIPTAGLNLQTGIYFLLIKQDAHKNYLKLIKYH